MRLEEDRSGDAHACVGEADPRPLKMIPKERSALPPRGRRGGRSQGGKGSRAGSQVDGVGGGDELVTVVPYPERRSFRTESGEGVELRGRRWRRRTEKGGSARFDGDDKA